jgi:pimeloyl-ACP methyl ester carboxylesterase
LDLPGFGRSDESDVLYSPDRYVEALRALTQQRIGRPFHLVGHSMGGAISLLFAGTYPDNVERLVLADVAGILHRHALAEHLAYLTERKAPVSGRGARGPVGLVTGALKQTLRAVDVSPRSLISSDLARNKLLGNDPQTVAALTLVEFNFGPAAAAVRAPTLLIWGRNDNVAPLRTADVLAARISGASLRILEGSAHVPMSTEPDAFVDAAHRHLSGAALPVPAKTTGAASVEPGVCRHQETAVFEGPYDTIDIVNCGRVTIRDASAVSITIEASTVEIENTAIEGGDVGLTAIRSNVAMTGGGITAPTAIHAIDGTLDLAGVEIVGKHRAVSETTRAKLLLSICKVKSPFIDEHLHGLFSISPENPLEINTE